jgi:hypothetical protein
MKTLLRCRRTRCYLQGEEQWTLDRALARDFGSGPQAIQFVMSRKMDGVELVLAFDDPQYDIILPLAGLGGNR